MSSMYEDTKSSEWKGTAWRRENENDLISHGMATDSKTVSPKKGLIGGTASDEEAPSEAPILRII